jgi:hypothetical protein
MRGTGKPAARAVLHLCPPLEDAQPRSSTPVCGLPPSRGKFVLHGFDCRIIRRYDGLLGCYIHIPYTHELYGETDLSQLGLVLECADGITYAASGAQGWFIGSATQLAWEDARRLLDELTRHLAEFTPLELLAASRIERVSGIRLQRLFGAGGTPSSCWRRSIAAS